MSLNTQKHRHKIYTSPKNAIFAIDLNYSDAALFWVIAYNFCETSFLMISGVDFAMNFGYIDARF